MPGESPEPAKQRGFAGLRTGLFFKKRMQPTRNPGCASFIEAAGRASWLTQFYFRFFRQNSPRLTLPAFSAYNKMNLDTRP
jgi:hypothetical protein